MRDHSALRAHGFGNLYAELVMLNAMTSRMQMSKVSVRAVGCVANKKQQPTILMRHHFAACAFKIRTQEIENVLIVFNHEVLGKRTATISPASPDKLWIRWQGAYIGILRPITFWRAGRDRTCAAVDKTAMQSANSTARGAPHGIWQKSLSNLIRP